MSFQSLRKKLTVRICGDLRIGIIDVCNSWKSNIEREFTNCKVPRNFELMTGNDTIKHFRSVRSFTYSICKIKACELVGEKKYYHLIHTERI